LAIFVGVPALILGLPIAMLTFLSVRRRQIFETSELRQDAQPSSMLAWPVAALSLLGITAIVFFVTTFSFAH